MVEIFDEKKEEEKRRREQVRRNLGGIVGSRIDSPEAERALHHLGSGRGTVHATPEPVTKGGSSSSSALITQTKRGALQPEVTSLHTGRTVDVPTGTIRRREELLQGDEEDDQEVEYLWKDGEIKCEEEQSLKDIYINSEDAELKRAIEALCTSHKDLFCSTVRKDPAKFRAPMAIEVDAEKWSACRASMRARERIQSKEKTEEVRNQVELLLKHGCIRESHATEYSQVVLAKKPNNKWRFCIDFRLINSVSNGSGWPIPNIKEMLTRLGNQRAKFFGVIDLTSGYHQAEVHPESRKYTAFITSMGVYEWVRLPMGIKSAPGYFQSEMAHTLRGLLYDICELYLDDVIIYGRTKEEYMKNLDTVLSRLREKNVSVNPAKCRFGMRSVEYVGHVVDEKGLTMSEKKIAKVVDFNLPATVKQLRSFLGLVNFFRDHIRDHSRIVKPLHDMIDNKNKNKSAPLRWTDAAKAAFAEMKTRVAHLQKLFFITDEDPIFLYTDASDYGIGAYLFQVVDGKEQPIAFYSKSLTGSQLNWLTIEKECYAIFVALREFEYLLQSRFFTLKTDHHNLIHLNESANKRVRRWKIEIQQYDFDIEHVRGQDNIVADAFSRCVEDFQEIEIPSKITARGVATLLCFLSEKATSRERRVHFFFDADDRRILHDNEPIERTIGTGNR